MDIEYATCSELRNALDSGALTSFELVEHLIDRAGRIDSSGPCLRSIIELNPDVLDLARRLDQDRRRGRIRGPLHGIPVLLKDNIDTADRMHTTAGSLALYGAPPRSDATVAARLRAQGAILFGKANMSEWANFRSAHSSSGWSARGGQCRNPHVIDRTPAGSSSGSAVAVAAGLATLSLGTETDGSIISPAAMCGVVGVKPTVGLTSRAGVVPIAHSQDTVGPMARCVKDAALLLGAITGADPRDPASTGSPQRLDYVARLNGNLRGVRIGIPRRHYFAYSPAANRVIEEAIPVLEAAGAVMVDPADLPSAAELAGNQAELEVLLYEFKADLNAYLAGRYAVPVGSLDELIDFNRAYAEHELALFGQDLLEAAAAKGPLTDPAYVRARAECLRLSRREGIDAVMDEHRLNALLVPSQRPAWPIDVVNGNTARGGSTSAPAMAGYPMVTVPAGMAGDLPVGAAFIGRAWSEPELLRIAHAFEQQVGIAPHPGFRLTIWPPGPTPLP